jgi:catechol 2,3-dioxygenase-like lactoylglutathione lyase family enzyme
LNGIKVKDICFARLQAPDLDVAERFLTDFGMVRAARTSNTLYMRGTDPSHHIHVTHLGPPKFIGLAFEAASEADLRSFAEVPGASAVEKLDEPGGGLRVRIRDPHGYQMEVVHAIEPAEPLPVQEPLLNWGGNKTRRAGELFRPAVGPSKVKRFGHAVIMCPNAGNQVKWYQDMFGLICSDAVYAGAKENVIASFNRCDRGDDFVDHHTFLCLEGKGVGLNHLSFEVQHLDDLMMGHEHLKSVGRYKHAFGIGRHLLGSQIFDYWQDPWGRIHEHWTDTDVLNARTPPNLVSAEEGLVSQWGAEVPEDFIGHVSP